MVSAFLVYRPDGILYLFVRKEKLMAKNNKKTETAQEILDGFKMKFMVAITVIFFGSMVAAFIWLFLKTSL